MEEISPPCLLSKNLKQISLIILRFYLFFNLFILFRGIKPGLTFLLRQGEVTLLCEVLSLPHYRLSEAQPSPTGFLLERRYSQ